MKYQYHDLSPAQFEDLVIGVCEELFGMGVQGFSDGMDGGRDARFEGKAQLFPSSSEPWSGITIIQAKHTSGINRSFSESDFFGNDSAQIDKEIQKVKRLYEETVDELQVKIAIYKNEYENFERLLDYIYDRLISRDVDLRKYKKATRVFLHYMYFYCDIG